MPALILQTVQQQVSHNHKVYLPKSQKPNTCTYMENTRMMVDTSGLAGGEILTDVTKSAHGLWRVISALSEYRARQE